MLVNWQSYPVAVWEGFPPYNWDYFSQTNIGGPMSAMTKHTSVVAEAALLPDPDDEAAVAEADVWITWYSNFVQPDESPNEPVSWFYVPIFDQVSQIRTPSSPGSAGDDEFEYNPEDHSVVGTMIGSLYWRSLMQNILPDGNDGIQVVFESPCNPAFTYQINGPASVFLGRGDRHDPSYNDHVISSPLYELNSFAIGESTYAGPPVDREYCPFTVNVYPSNMMRNDYTSNQPILFAIVAVLIFVFTTSLLVVYDCIVERRQKLVMNKAIRSTAIVSSLFPSEVQNRLEDEVAVGRSSSHTKKTVEGNTNSKTVL